MKEEEAAAGTAADAGESGAGEVPESKEKKEMNKLVFFDLETGGLSPWKHPIIQIAAVAVDEDFEVCEDFEVKVHFDPRACEPRALAMNSFNGDVWKREALKPERARALFSKFLERHATVKLMSKRGFPYFVAALAGHNAATFDGPFLQQWYKKASLFLPASFRVLCTLQLAQWAFLNSPDQPDDMKLGTLCQYFGVELPEEDAHDALADVRATAKLAKCLLEVSRAPDPTTNESLARTRKDVYANE